MAFKKKQDMILSLYRKFLLPIKMGKNCNPNPNPNFIKTYN